MKNAKQLREEAQKLLEFADIKEDLDKNWAVYSEKCGEAGFDDEGHYFYKSGVTRGDDADCIYPPDEHSKMWTWETYGDDGDIAEDLSDESLENLLTKIQEKSNTFKVEKKNYTFEITVKNARSLEEAWNEIHRIDQSMHSLFDKLEFARAE